MPQKKLIIAGCQMCVTKDINKNLQSITRGVEYAIAHKADIFITPEGSLSGYTHTFDQNKVQSSLTQVTQKAKEGKLALALGTCFYEKRNACYNQIRFYDKQGTYLGFHSKILRCCNPEKRTEGEFNNFHSSKLKVFNFHGILIGGLICNDLWANPIYTSMTDTHLSQQLSDMGAQIIFHSVNTLSGGKGIREIYWNYHEANLLMRALAGRIWIVSANNCYPTDKDAGSPSGIINPNGEWVKKLKSRGEQFYHHEIKL